MAISEQELIILLKARDEMTKVIKKARGEIEQTEKSSQNMKKALTVLGGALVAATAAAGKMGVELVSMAKQAAPVQSIRAAFDELSGSADETLAKLQEGSHGMVASAELMKTYNAAVQLVGKSFADDLPDAMSTLSKVSASTGESMGFLLDSLVKGVGRLSPMILDNLSVQVDLTQAYKAWAQQMGVTTASMSKADQQAAVMAETIRQLKVNTGGLPEVTGTLSQRMAEMEAKMADARIELGTAFIPVLEAFYEQVGPLTDSLAKDLVPALENLVPTLVKVVEMLSKVPGVLDRAKLEATSFNVKLRDEFTKSGGVVTERIQEIIDHEIEMADRTSYATGVTGDMVREMAEKIRVSVANSEAEFARFGMILERQEQVIRAQGPVLDWWKGEWDETSDYILAQMEDKASPRLQAHWAKMRGELEEYQAKVEEETKRHHAMLEAFNEEFYAGVAALAQEGQMELLRLTEEWGADRIQVEDEVLQALLDLTSDRNMEAQELAYERSRELQTIEAEYARDMEVLRARNDQKAMEQRTTAYNQEIGLTKEQFSREDQLSERARLIARVKEIRGQIQQLTDLGKHYDRKIKMMVLEAGQEAKLDAATIKQKMEGMGLVIDAETEMAITHAEINKQKLLNDQAYAKGSVDALKSMVDAQLKVQGQALDEAMTNLNNWSPPALELPPLQLGGMGDIGGVGGALDQVNEQAESVNETVGRITESLTDAIGRLRDYQQAENLGASVQALIDDSQLLADKLIEYFQGWDQAAIDAANEAAKASAAMAAMFGPMQTIAGTVSTIAAMGEDTAETFGNFQMAVDHLYVHAQAIMGMLQVLVPEWEESAESWKQGAAYISAFIAPIGSIANNVKTLQEFGMQTADKFDNVQMGIDHIRVATVAIMGMLQEIVPDWENSAKDWHEGAGYIAEMVKPISTMAKSVEAVEEFATQTADTFPNVQMGLDHIFAATGAILAMLRVLVPAWADTAESMSEGSAHVASAVKPIADMAKAVQSVEEFAGQTANAFPGIEVGIDHIFAGTGAILAMLRVLAPAWGETAEGITEASGHVASAVKPIGDMAGAVQDVEEFATQTADTFPAIQMGINHIYAGTGAILAMLRELAPAWGETAAGIKEASGHVASAVKPIGDMAGAVKAVEEFAKDTAESFPGVQMGINHIYAATGAILAMLRELAPAWAETAAGIKEGSADIASAVSPIATMAQAVKAVEEFGKTTADGFAGVQLGIDHTFVATGAILAMLRTLVPAWAETAEDIAEGSGYVAKAVAPFATMVNALQSISQVDFAAYSSPNIAQVTMLANDAKAVAAAVLQAFGEVTTSVETIKEKADALSARGNIVSSAIGIISTMVGMGALDEYEKPNMALVGRIAEDAKAVTAEVYKTFKLVTDDLQGLKDNAEAFSARGSIVSTALGILDTMLGLGDLADYIPPDIDEVTAVAEDAKTTTKAVADVVSSMYTDLSDMESDAKLLTTMGEMITGLDTTIAKTISVAQGLAELSWRKVKKNQVDSFTNNFANIVGWLTDPESGVQALVDLSDFTAYELAGSQLGTLVENVVESIRTVMTLPAVWDNRITLMGTGFAGFFENVKRAIINHSGAIVEGVEAASQAAFAALGARIASEAIDARDAFTGVFNDGVFLQLGIRNAVAYGDGWERGLQIGSPSKVAERLRQRFEEGLGATGASSKEYHLHITTTQPAVNVMGSYRLLEALG